MSDSLLEEIMQQEEALRVHISNGKRQIRARLEKKQNELEVRYEKLLKRLGKHNLKLQKAESLKNIQKCQELTHTCDEIIRKESSLTDGKILQLLEELLSQELLRGSYDHKDVKG